MEEANRTDQTVLVHRFDLDRIRDYRERWGVYRDRRLDLYGALTTRVGCAGTARGPAVRMSGFFQEPK